MPMASTAIVCNARTPAADADQTSECPTWSKLTIDPPPPIYVASEDVALPLTGFATIAADLKTFATHHDPALAGVLLISVRRPAVDEFTVLKDIVERQSAVVPIVIVETCETGLAVELMKAGAADVLESPVDAKRLEQALVDAVARTQQRGDSESATRLARARIESLSPRERSVLNGLICGWPNKIIAGRLALSPRTVEIHRAKLMTKLQVRTLAQVLQLAFAARITFEDADCGSPMVA